MFNEKFLDIFLGTLVMLALIFFAAGAVIATLIFLF